MDKASKDNIIRKRHLLELERDYWFQKYQRFTMTEVPEGFSLRQGTGIGLIGKYAGVDTKGRLFPFISPQKYNDDIKDIFRLCGVTRLVTVIDSVTGKETQRPINEVASSHMARRCFVGNLYKKVKDPNLIASMSGHAEGSRAFARYREIDDEVKKEVVSLID